MKTKIIMGGLTALVSIGNAQNTFPWPSSANVGIGTTSPNVLLDVRGRSTFGGGATEATNYAWTSGSNERSLILTGNAAGGFGSYGTFLLGSNAAEAAGQTLGVMVFGQNQAGISPPRTANAGLKAAIFGISSGTGGSPGGYGGDLRFCTSPNNPNISTNLTERMRIDLNGNVGIGTASPGARLHVVGTVRGIIADAGTNNTDIALQGNGYVGVDGNGSLVGVRGTCSSGPSSTKIGVRGDAGTGSNNIGGYFRGVGGASGVAAYGVVAFLDNQGLGGTSYGIYSDAGGLPYSSPTGAGPVYAGYFNGDLVVAAGCYSPSDRRIKKDIAGISNSMDIISKLKPVTYNFNTEDNKNVALPASKQYGFISQEIQEILPELTKTIIHPAKLDAEGKELYPAKEILGLNYNGFIAILAKGMQEQQAQIDAQQKTIVQQSQINTDLQKQLDEQKQLISNLSQKVSGATGINSAGGVDNGFSMLQNEPNPFSHETVVKYTLPQSINSASMYVYDLTGKQITTLPITEKGSSSITITSEKLSAGIYIYTIVADGKVMDSKRMIVAEK